MASVQELGLRAGVYNQLGFDNLEDTQLHVACGVGNDVLLQKLLANPNLKAMINIKNQSGQTPLSLAISKKSVECSAILINAKADVKICDKSGWQPIHLACMYGLEGIVSLLAENGADLDAKNELKDAKTPLFCALVNRKVACAKFLINRGADVSACTKHGLKARSIANDMGLEEIVNMLPKNESFENLHDIV